MTLRMAASSLGVVLLAAVLPFVPTLGTGFVADDFFFAWRYRSDTSGVVRTLWSLFTGGGAATTSFYRPVAFFSLWAEMRAWTDPALAMHATQLLLHAVVAMAAWRVAAQLVGPRAGVAALLGAAWFAAFPRRVEAVAWLSCRPDLLAAAFGLGALIVWGAALRRGRVGAAVAAAVLWGFSLLSKESALLLPVALACWPVVSGAPPVTVRTRVRLLVPFVVVGAAYLALRRMALGAFLGGYADSTGGSVIGAVARVPRHVAYQILVPLEGADRWLEHGTGAAVATALVVGVVVALASLAWQARASAALRGGVLWLAVTVAPVVAYPVSLTTTFNDRLLYLPGVGMAFVLAGVLAHVGRGWRIGVAVALAGAALGSVEVSTRWRAAGRATSAIVTDLARQLDRLPDGSPVVVAAAPDSVRGAYMLRNGVAEALALAGHPVRGGVQVASVYFVEALDRMPVEVSRIAAGRVRVAGTDGARAVLPEPTVLRAATHEVEGTADRFGRVAALTFAVDTTSVVVVLTPTGARSVPAVRDAAREDGGP